MQRHGLRADEHRIVHSIGRGIQQAFDFFFERITAPHGHGTVQCRVRAQQASGDVRIEAKHHSGRYVTAAQILADPLIAQVRVRFLQIKYQVSLYIIYSKSLTAHVPVVQHFVPMAIEEPTDTRTMAIRLNCGAILKHSKDYQQHRDWLIGWRRACASFGSMLRKSGEPCSPGSTPSCDGIGSPTVAYSKAKRRRNHWYY